MAAPKAANNASKMIAQNLPLLTVAETAPRCIGLQKREIVFRGQAARALR
jgi:hypothetical protein